MKLSKDYSLTLPRERTAKNIFEKKSNCSQNSAKAL